MSSLSFLRTSQDNNDLVVFNPPMLPTTLMIRLSEFIYETLFLKLLQTTIAVKKLLIIGEGFCPSHMHGLAFFIEFHFCL